MIPMDTIYVISCKNRTTGAVIPACEAHRDKRGAIIMYLCLTEGDFLSIDKVDSTLKKRGYVTDDNGEQEVTLQAVTLTD